MKQPAIGLTEALAQLTASYDSAEQRLAERMKPARLAPLNFTHRNGRAASREVINEIRREQSLHPQSACA